MLEDWVPGIASHIGVTVPSLAEGRKFYCELLGFEETATYESQGAFIDEIVGIENVIARTAMLAVPGGMRIQLQEFVPPGRPQSFKHNDPGMTHISWGVRDVRAEYQRLTAQGVTFRCEPIDMEFDNRDHPMNGWTVTYFDDPWGLPLELLGPTPATSTTDVQVQDGKQGAV